MTVTHTDPARCAAAIVDCVGREIVLAIPNGIGKPNLLTNALYRLAEADRRVQLKIFTGLTLVRPRYRSDLERRFVAPLLDRLFGSWPDLAYAEAMRKDGLPPNIEVHEFFLQAGQWLANPAMQQSYTSLSYSHVGAHLRRIGINVMAQLVAPRAEGHQSHVSLSSNPDVSLDMKDYVLARRAGGLPIAIVGELNANLPYMPGSAEVAVGEFDLLCNPPAPHFALFAPPKEPVPLADYAMALHAATLVKDGGTLQIGIGSFADALCHALVLRHTKNTVFRGLIAKLVTPLHPDADLAPFKTGLYGNSEMLVDGFLALRRAGILTRRVRDTDQNGITRDVILHAGFFLGSTAFYDELRTMTPDDLDDIAMSAISFTNTLLGDTAGKIAQRVHARFINTAMIATLLGAGSADQLEDGRVVSGIGGQGDFVTMSHDLPGARSIIGVRSTRQAGRGTVMSNILWSYGNTSVPRQLRDIFVTEYGIADVRGRSDREVAAAMLAIADSRFQPGLQKAAATAGKLPPAFALPAWATSNSPGRISETLAPARREGLLPVFPLGTEMTDTEQALIPVLGTLRGAKPIELMGLLALGYFATADAGRQRAGLQRMSLDDPTTLREKAMRALVLGAMLSERR